MKICCTYSLCNFFFVYITCMITDLANSAEVSEIRHGFGISEYLHWLFNPVQQLSSPVYRSSNLMKH